VKGFRLTSVIIASAVLAGCAQQPSSPSVGKPLPADAVYIVAPRSAAAECKLASRAILKVSGGNEFNSQMGAGGGCVIMNTGMGPEVGPLSGVREIQISPLGADRSKVIALPETGTAIAQLLGGKLIVTNLDKHFAFHKGS